MEELNLEYNIKTYKRDKDFRAPRALEQIHPLGRSPVLEIEYLGSEKTRAIAESGHIVQFLLRNFDKDGLLDPKNAEDFDLAEYHTHMAEGTLQAVLTFVLVLRNGQGKAPWAIRPIIRGYNDKIIEAYNAPQAIKVLDMLESTLAEKAKLATSSSQELFIVGQKLSAADIMLSFPVAELCIFEDRLSTAGFDKAKYPYLVRWAHQIRERPAYIRAFEKTSGY